MIDLILFDLDGVITSERTYWSCACACVLDMLMFTPVSDKSEAERIVLNNDKTLRLLKNMSCNSNWDLTDMIYQAARLLGAKKDDLTVFERVYEFFYSMRDKNMYEVYEYFKENGGYLRDDPSWQETADIFNNKYYGEFQNLQCAVTDIERIKQTLGTLNKAYTLGVGTGRPQKDTDAAFDILGIREYFDPDRVITYDAVTCAQKRHNKSSLGKPSPYIFLRGMIGLSADDAEIVKTNRCERAKSTLIVGDAASDIAAAKAAGAKFCAVLTGASGSEARSFFESAGADFILDDVTLLADLMKG